MKTCRRNGVLLFFVLMAWLWGEPSGSGAGQPVIAKILGQADDIARTIHIQNRRFVPHLVNLRVGQPVRLILKNQDVELHAFVPMDLLARTNVQVGGNGAPEFGKDGFRRVLIPSRGQVELVFVPKEEGAFAFFCDLPGHVMNGTIVVNGRENMLE